MPELLKRARVVLAMGSSLIAETVAAGVPTILVGSEADLNFDPLDWDLGVDRRIAYRPEQIREQVESIVPDPSAPHDRVARDLIGFFALSATGLKRCLRYPTTGATSQGGGHRDQGPASVGEEGWPGAIVHPVLRAGRESRGFEQRITRADRSRHRRRDQLRRIRFIWRQRAGRPGQGHVPL